MSGGDALEDQMDANRRRSAALARVRALFVHQPIFRDLQLNRTAFFQVTDFLKPLHPSLIDDIAQCFIDSGSVPFQDADVLVSIADRSSGPITHAVSCLTGVPYTLANWYPLGSPGEIEVEKMGGFSGTGVVYLNGIRSRHQKAIIVMDVLKTGTTAANLVKALQSHGVKVIHCVFATELIEAEGRKVEVFADIPITTLIPIHLRGECTKEATWSWGSTSPQHQQQQASHALGSPSPSITAGNLNTSARGPLPTTAAGGVSPRGGATGAGTHFSPNRSMTPALTNSGTSGAATPTPVLVSESVIDPIPRQLPSLLKIIRKMDPESLRQKLERVAATFIHIPIHNNPQLSYPYSFFTLTDFIPVMPASLVEDMADLMVYYGDIERCDVLVSEADRGGGPLVQAVAMRTNRPYVLANWYASGEGLGAASKVQVGFSGEGNIVVNGIGRGQRCTFVDDMLSSGGTAEGVLKSIEALGGIPVEAIFISEKLYPPAPVNKTANSNGKVTAVGLPQRKGKRRLAAIWPHLDITTVIQFVASGERTSAPLHEVG
jgi:adenine/guanine phosphoribosyltransferase-like PRPP-binding protein